MKNPVVAFRLFVRNLGPVEQAQIVASTAVIVSMATIISAMVVTGQTPRLMDFISILTVGTIGFTNVYFSLRYSRQLDEQRRQLLAMNTIAEAVNRVVELDIVLQTSLDKITELLGTDYGWIYMLEGDRLVLKCSKGTTMRFLPLNGSSASGPGAWLHQPRVQRERLAENLGDIDPAFKAMGIQFWSSIPLKVKESVAGALIVAGREYEMFSSKQAELVETFGNQISVALNNAQLFERLKQSEKEYVDLFENAPDIYLSVSRRHIIVGCNTTGAAMLRVPKSELIGKPFEHCFVENRRDAVRDVVEGMFTEGRGLKDAEEQMLKSGDQPFPVTLNSSLVFDDKGATVNARIVARDISERKMMESALLHAQKIDSIGNLAGGHRARFQQHPRRRPRLRLDHAEAADRKIEAVQVRGDHRILRAAGLLPDAPAPHVRPEDGDHRQARGHQRAYRGDAPPLPAERDKGDRGDHEPDRHGRVGQRRRRPDPAGAAEYIPERPRCHARGGEAERRDRRDDGGCPHDEPVLLDQTRAVRRHHDQRYGPRDRGEHTEPRVRAFLHDEGFGDRARALGRVRRRAEPRGIHQPGERGGTGDHVQRLSSRAPMRTRPRQPARDGSAVPHGKENILIIDDEISVCEIARDMLAGLGYTVYVEHDGKSGVDLYRIRQATIDLILLDINMPVMGGKQTFEVLRSINPLCRIIIMTGYGREGVETSNFSSEVNAFMQKPFQLEMLALKVREILDGRTPVPAETVPQ